MKIAINEPCHENWDKMTPNDKGAFCLSCKKNVVDFSSKTLTEIKDFFKDLPGTENVCGRFKTEQLNEITFDDFFMQFRSWNFFRKVAVVMFFIFGTTLFSCSPRVHEPLMGKVAVENPKKPVCAEPTGEKTVKGDVSRNDTIVEEHEIIKGKIKVK